MDGERAGKLLLVEDENVLRGLIAQFLRKAQHEVVEAADGVQGVELFASAGPFDVILLDLNLPLLSGVDVCRQIKNINPLQPVIVCSAAILDSHADALLELGVSQFLNKPYHPKELLERIATELARASEVVSSRAANSIYAPHWQLKPSEFNWAHRRITLHESRPEQAAG
jgi:DNA-binding response OmpR family regulator